MTMYKISLEPIDNVETDDILILFNDETYIICEKSEKLYGDDGWVFIPMKKKYDKKVLKTSTKYNIDFEVIIKFLSEYGKDINSC